MLSEQSSSGAPLSVGIAGTFDIENYGDLLFPLIAAAALQRRDRRMHVVPFSINGKVEPSWPFPVRPTEQIVASIPTLSAMLIGGGQIVTFDDRYYPVPVPENVAMPVAYWLIPAVQAALAGTPVIWNAVGASTGSSRVRRHDGVVRQVLAASYFVGVRDRVSRDNLAQLAPDAGIEFLPDTAFGLSRLWPLEEESAAFTNWRRSLGVEGEYVVIQANLAVGRCRSTIEAALASMGKINAVILPVCWCHGDRAEEFPELKGRVFRSREWLAPKLISEIIGRSAFVFGSSLHACITALSYGVPGARVPFYSDRKFELLDEFEGIVHVGNGDGLSRLIGRGRRIEARVIDYADRLERYWDNVSEVVLQPPIEHCNASRALMMGWVSEQCGERRRAGLTRRFGVGLRRRLGRRLPLKNRVAIHHRFFLLRNLAVNVLRRSVHYRAMGAKSKSAGEMARRADGVWLGNSERRTEPVLDMRRIARQKMETEPYQWALIDQLFSVKDAAGLAASFPRDHCKKVSGNDGEKSYEYMSRSLIHMGAAVPSYPEGLSPAWRALADDLLSSEYRSALIQMTGVDLSSALLEVNLIHYGPGAWLGPHVDLKAKIMTHVLYFNETWEARQGGCLTILRSSDPGDVLTEILPVVGNSVLMVRSNHSWHSVSRVVRNCRTSRRSVNVIFHLPGSISSMWPPGENPVLQDYAPAC